MRTLGGTRGYACIVIAPDRLIDIFGDNLRPAMRERGIVDDLGDIERRLLHQAGVHGWLLNLSFCCFNMRDPARHHAVELPCIIIPERADGEAGDECGG